MLRFSLALAAFAALTTLPVSAETIPDGCYPAVQNWANGSGYTCPIMGGSGVGSQSPTFIAPTIPTTTITPITCGSASADILPPVLRRKTMNDVAITLVVSDCP